MRYLILVILTISFFSACRKDKAVPTYSTYEPCYQKFLGNYRVLNTDSNTYYNMSITHYQDTNQYGNIVDHLSIQNFANKFNLITQFQCTVDSNRIGNFLDIGPHDSTYDYNGYRWYLWGLTQDSVGNRTSWLQNDTINLYFYMCNIAFYIYDAQPYYCKNVMHIALKQH